MPSTGQDSSKRWKGISMEALPAGEAHTNVLAIHPHFIRLPQPRGPGGQGWAGNTSHIHGIHPPNQLRAGENKSAAFCCNSSSSSCILLPRLHGCWSWTQIHVLGAISSLGGGNGEVRRQGWNFPPESCKMQTLRLPNSCTKRQRAEIHFLQRTSHQGIQVQHLPWDTASWKTEEQEKENSSNCLIRGGTFFKAEHESDVIKTQGSSWIERKSPSLHHLAAWIWPQTLQLDFPWQPLFNFPYLCVFLQGLVHSSPAVQQHHPLKSHLPHSSCPQLL